MAERETPAQRAERAAVAVLEQTMAAMRRLNEGGTIDHRAVAATIHAAIAREIAAAERAVLERAAEVAALHVAVLQGATDEARALRDTAKAYAMERMSDGARRVEAAIRRLLEAT